MKNVCPIASGAESANVFFFSDQVNFSVKVYSEEAEI